MKKRSLFVAAYLAMGAAVMFTSCSNDDDVINGGNGNGNEPEQVLTLQVSNTDNTVKTRGRDLYSSEAKQTIDKVKVVIYQEEQNGDLTVHAIKDFDKWNTDAVSSIYETNGHGREAAWALKGEEKLQEGETYKVVALGYSDGDYSTSINNFTSLTTTSGTLSLPLTPAIEATGIEADEIFAGALSELKVGDQGTLMIGQTNVQPVVTLHRQVAGTFGYFKNIPAKDATGKYKATKLRLVAANVNTKLVLDQFNSSFTETGANVNYVVNGLTSSTATKVNFNNGDEGYEVYSIDLLQWFTSGDENQDGFYGQGDTWVNVITDAKAKFEEGSVFAGKFLIPSKFVDTTSTFELQLIGEAIDGGDEVVIKHWNIKNTEQKDKKAIVVSGTDNFTWNEAATADSETSYSIVRNHLYTLGHKGSDDSTTDPDPDEPEDLSKNQDLVIKVNDNWEAIHEMEID